jgi:hypothetical protein
MRAAMKKEEGREMQGERGKDNNKNGSSKRVALLEVEWMKELMCMFTLTRVSLSLGLCNFVLSVSNNTQSLCIAHPIVIFSSA